MRANLRLVATSQKGALYSLFCCDMGVRGMPHTAAPHTSSSKSTSSPLSCHHHHLRICASVRSFVRLQAQRIKTNSVYNQPFPLFMLPRTFFSKKEKNILTGGAVSRQREQSFSQKNRSGNNNNERGNRKSVGRPASDIRQQSRSCQGGPKA
jgi:hypothetical protein